MLKILTKFFFLTFLLVIAGSVSSQTRTGSNEVGNTIDLAAAFKNSQTIRLSEIADSVTFVPFETTSESLQGQGQNALIRFTPQYIFYRNMYYDWNGNFCGVIENKGQGPLEDPEGATGLIYSNNHFYSKGTKFIEYDMKGKPTGKVRNIYQETGDLKDGFSRMKSELGRSFCFTAVGDNFISYDRHTATIFYINNKFETITTRKMYQTDSIIPDIGANQMVTFYKEKALFYNFFNDTIFHVTDSGLEPRWIVSFNHPSRVSNQALLNTDNLRREFMQASRGNVVFSGYEKLMDHKHLVINVHETDFYVFFHMWELLPFAEFRGKTSPLTFYICYDKTTGKTFRLKEGYFVNDLIGIGSKTFYPRLDFFDEKMISFMWPYQILDFVEESKKSGREANPKILALSKKIAPEDNPILILVHLKNKK